MTDTRTWLNDREIIHSGSVVCLSDEFVTLAPFGEISNDKIIIYVKLVEEEKDATVDTRIEEGSMVVEYRRTWSDGVAHIRYGITFALDGSPQSYDLRCIIKPIGQIDNYGFELIYNVFRNQD